MPDHAIAVACVHAERCSGCALISRAYPEQLAWKEEALRRELGRYPDLGNVHVAGTVPGEPITEYRARAKLVADGARLGLFARGTHDVVDIPECRVVSAKLARTIAAIRADLPLPFALVGVDVREVDSGALVTFIVEEGVNDDLVREAAKRLRKKEPSVVGVAVSRNERGAPRLLWAAPRPLEGATSAAHRLAPDEPFVEASFGSFVQAHPRQAARLYGAVQTALERHLGALDGASVLELYAGSGALALRLARAGADVTAVESFEPAAKALARAADAQRLRVRALAVDAEAALENTELRPRAVVLDPPRRGLSPSVRHALAALRPSVTAYVSCSPATLARDLAHLMRLGLGVESVTPFDMIPLSDAVEALAVLVPQAIPPVRILHDEDAFVAVDKPPFLPTTPQGEHRDSLLARVRALPGLARAAPIHRLDAGTSGVCLFARLPDQVEAVARALSQGTKTYVTLLRGVVRAKGSIRRPLRDGTARRDAQTRYRRERVAGTHSLVHAQPEQGRQHQIRRHFAGLGHPVLGDERYGHAASNRYFAEKHGLDRPFLHAAEVELAFSDRTTRIRAALAPDLAAVLASLERE